MPASIPSVLAPYLQSCQQPGSTTLITSVLDTPANWVVLQFIRVALFGIDDEVGTGAILSENAIPDNKSACVVFISFIRSYDFWSELGKKVGIEISSLTTKKRLSYIDALTIHPSASSSPPSSKTIKPKSHSLQDLTHALTTAKSAFPPETTTSPPTLIIDGLDFILASQPDLTPSELTTFLTTARTQFRSVALTVSADAPLLHNTEASATPLEVGHGVFVRGLAYQCGWVYQLRPLETGFAKDVSGVVRVSRGGDRDWDRDGEVEGHNGLVDGEWLYRVKGDGSVRVWSRGE